MHEDDASLIAQIGTGSERAFNILIDRHQHAVRTFVRTLTSDADDADDLAQETFVAAWSQARKYRGASSVRSWLCAIAWRKARGLHRAAFRRRDRETAWRQLAPDHPDGRADAEARLSATQALATLPGDQRAVLALCLGCGFTHEEAAMTLGLPLGTVKSHIVRGRTRLLALLGDDR